MNPAYGNKELVHFVRGNTSHAPDAWGAFFPRDGDDLHGGNALGNIWMQLREESGGAY